MYICLSQRPSFLSSLLTFFSKQKEAFFSPYVSQEGPAKSPSMCKERFHSNLHPSMLRERGGKGRGGEEE